MSRRALSFGQAASSYERFRPGYPDQILADVCAYSGRPIRTALEIGAGTGKATRLFAAHDIAVTATEPDAAMVAELRKHVPDTVTIVRAALEDLAPSQAYDLIYAAAALHWTEPTRRWSRVAALLAPHGVFAAFGGPVQIFDPDIEKAARAAGSPWLSGDDVPAADDTPVDSPMQWPGTELLRSGLFTDVRQSSIERRMTIPASDYVGHLSTVSAYLELPEPDRGHVLTRILEVLPAQVTVTADVEVHLARLSSSTPGPARQTPVV